MRLPRESDTDWQGCKNASQEVLKQLWKLNVGEMAIAATITFPERIDCNDRCDPDSLVKNSMLCLVKIRRGLHHYQELLRQYSTLDSTAELQTAMRNLLQLLPKDGVSAEDSSPAEEIAIWEKTFIEQHILQRLQLFAVLVARVFAHCAALK
ncbi:interleukin-23 subunit alpha [Python bivittatus]|uniref:Interleukin-23 subunit alpha n=1 Tax=Python bivittatus TaxID=176946 RepID=A0A9F5INW3_PYTBI|nr:interleukin-23 subunit alpha [Python bivittatus]